MKDSVPFLPRQHDDDTTIFDEAISDTELKRVIRSLHLKVTNQRMVILKCLHAGSRHVTAQELYEEVNSLHPEIGFATVYRFLRTLTEGGFASEVRLGGLPARYELNSKSHHDHLTCTQCGKICEFENKKIEALQEKVATEFGFRLTHHVLELYGLCPSCQS